MKFGIGMLKKWRLDMSQVCWSYMNCANETLYTDYCKSSACFSYGWKLLPPVVRYKDKHIGLGTKKFVDALGSC